MRGIIKKYLVFYLIILLLGLFSASKTYAASLANVSDTITTSRPSAAAPLNADQAASAGQISVVDNGSIYLASDSAILQSDTGQTQDIVNVASMSAQISGSPNTRNVYFTSAITNTHHKGTAAVVNITAQHQVRFTTISAVPGSGHVVINFGGSGSNIASPSASTFSFNGLTSANASTYVQTNNATCSSFTVSAPSIDCTLNGSGIAASTTVTFLIGCTTQSSGTCTAASPKLINPTKSAAAGTADTWKVTIKTQDASAIDLDSSTVKIATVDAVQVQGTVEPSLTFTIAGFADNTDINTISGSCGSITTNSGIATTATFVNLGFISNAAVNRAAQRLSVATNGASGYAITATSSGRFINPASGFWITQANIPDTSLTANETPAPGTIAAGTPGFGIHPCGARSSVFTDQWVNAGAIATAKFSNPWNTGANNYYATLASYTGGPVNSEDTAVLYGATVGATTPAGIYSTIFTYVATATF